MKSGLQPNPALSSLWLLGMLAILPFSASPQSFPSLDDFETHVQLHILRVEHLGLEIFETWPDDFEGIHRTLLMDFLKIHDKTKLTDRTILQSLYQLSGSDFENLPKSEREAALALRDRLNKKDGELALEFFKKRGLLNTDGKPGKIAEKLLRIERVSDVVDRMHDPVARIELGVREKPPITKFLKTRKELLYARWLEDRYVPLVAGLGHIMSETPQAKGCLRKALATPL